MESLKGLTNQSRDAVQFWIIWALSLPRILLAGLQMEDVFLKGKLKAKISSLCLTFNNSVETLCICPQIPIKHVTDLVNKVRRVTAKTMMHRWKEKSNSAKLNNLKDRSLKTMCR